MAELDMTALTWRKSSWSGSDDACVEVAFVDGGVGIRDSRAPRAGVLVVSRTAWQTFIDGIRASHVTPL